MVDRYIDYDETQTYGAHCQKTLAGLASLDGKSQKKAPKSKGKNDGRGAAKQTASFAFAFDLLAMRVRDATLTVGAALDKARATAKGVRVTAADKGGVVPAAEDSLTSLNYWVKAHPEIDPKDFFPKGRSKIKSTADGLLAGLNDAEKGFDSYLHIPEAKQRKASIVRLASQLQASIDGATAAKGGTVVTSPTLVRARQDWLRTYGAAKLIAEGIFRLEKPNTDVDAQMKAVFADLRVPSRRNNKNKSGAPAATPPESPAPAPSSAEPSGTEEEP